MGATAEVLQVPRGSLIVITGVEAEPEVMSSMGDAMAEILGHHEFLVLNLPSDGSAEVWSIDDDLVARFRALFDTGAWDPTLGDDEPDPADDDAAEGPPAPIIGVPGPPPIQLPQLDDVLDGKRVIR